MHPGIAVDVMAIIASSGVMLQAVRQLQRLPKRVVVGVGYCSITGGGLSG